MNNFEASFLGIFLGLITFFVAAISISARRKSLLNEIDFTINGPSVPIEVMIKIKSAEKKFYDELSFFRKLAEDLQDILGILFPSLVYKLNFSVGAYRIKPKTIKHLIEYAIENNFLIVRTQKSDRYNYLLAYFSLQPLLNDWQASVILEELKNEHPKLKKMSWESIVNDDKLIAKLYSGYMGAGGDFDAWKSNIEPGDIAKYRILKS